MSIKTGRKSQVQQAIVDGWMNAANGTAVIVKLDSGEERRTRTRSQPFLLGGHTAVIQLEGIPGCYSLERVRRADQA